MLTLLQMLICKDSGKIEVNSSNGFHQMVVDNKKTVLWYSTENNNNIEIFS